MSKNLGRKAVVIALAASTTLVAACATETAYRPATGSGFYRTGYSDTRIEIRDPALAREPVTGLFAASDPVGFSRAVAQVFDARLQRDGDTVVLSRGAQPPAAAQ